MSLSKLNYPPLIATLGIATIGISSTIQQQNIINVIDDNNNNNIPFIILQGANLTAYVLSVWSVSQKGRYDGQDQRIGDKNNDNNNNEMNKMSTGKHGLTLLPPAGWAFIIWAPIFLGEGIFAIAQCFVNENNNIVIASIIRQLTIPYVSGHIMQALWTASFRPKYNQGWYKYISAANLTGVAYFFSQVHATYTTTLQQQQQQPPTMLQHAIYFVPLTLHFGWTSAAALVNLNGVFALEDENKNYYLLSAKTMAWLGHLSVLIATTAGVYITTKRSAPTYGGVITWALVAVSSGLKKRLKETEKDDNKSRIGLYGIYTQRNLCLVGALVTGSAVVLTTLKQWTK